MCGREVGGERGGDGGGGEKEMEGVVDRFGRCAGGWGGDRVTACAANVGEESKGFFPKVRIYLT